MKERRTFRTFSAYFVCKSMAKNVYSLFYVTCFTQRPAQNTTPTTKHTQHPYTHTGEPLSSRKSKKARKCNFIFTHFISKASLQSNCLHNCLRRNLISVAQSEAQQGRQRDGDPAGETAPPRVAGEEPQR